MIRTVSCDTTAFQELMFTEEDVSEIMVEKFRDEVALRIPKNLDKIQDHIKYAHSYFKRNPLEDDNYKITNLTNYYKYIPFMSTQMFTGYATLPDSIDILTIPCVDLRFKTIENADLNTIDLRRINNCLKRELSGEFDSPNKRNGMGLPECGNKSGHGMGGSGSGSSSGGGGGGDDKKPDEDDDHSAYIKELNEKLKQILSIDDSAKSVADNILLLIYEKEVAKRKEQIQKWYDEIIARFKIYDELDDDIDKIKINPVELSKNITSYIKTDLFYTEFKRFIDEFSKIIDKSFYKDCLNKIQHLFIHNYKKSIIGGSSKLERFKIQFELIAVFAKIDDFILKNLLPNIVLTKTAKEALNSTDAEERIGAKSKKELLIEQIIKTLNKFSKDKFLIPKVTGALSLEQLLKQSIVDENIIKEYIKPILANIIDLEDSTQSINPLHMNILLYDIIKALNDQREIIIPDIPITPTAPQPPDE